MTNALDNIRLDVEKGKTPQASAIALVKGVRDSIDEIAKRATTLDGLKADLASLSADLGSASNDLAEATFTNTNGAGTDATVMTPMVMPASKETPGTIVTGGPASMVAQAEQNTKDNQANAKAEAKKSK